MKIAIIGAGNVGALCALHVARENLGEIVLVDILKGLAMGKAYDLEDSRAIMGVPFTIRGADDIAAIKDSAVVVITAGLARKPGMSREDLLNKNAAILKEVSHAIKRLCPGAVVVVVTNPLDAMTYHVLKTTGFPHQRVFGMGPTLDASRMSNLIAQELDVRVTDIQAAVIGSHGETMLPLPRFTKVKAKTLDQVVSLQTQEVLLGRTKDRGKEIVSLLGTGSAFFAPSLAAAEIVRCIVKDSRSILGVSAFLQGEYGLNDVCIGVPCRIGKEGIEEIIELDLNQSENDALVKSAESIRSQIKLLPVD